MWSHRGFSPATLRGDFRPRSGAPGCLPSPLLGGAGKGAWGIFFWGTGPRGHGRVVGSELTA